MNKNVIHTIEKKTGIAGIVGLLSEQLTGSELSSLLLAVFEQKTSGIKPAELLMQYRRNRLVQPSGLAMIGLLESQLAGLQFFGERGFVPVELSPVAALGSCSVVAAVSQDKVVSALRNTEVVADATNGLALHVADLRKREAGGELRFCTMHRHVRTQPFADPRFLPHFVVGCLVTGGRDTGSFGFECGAVAEHLGVLVDLLRDVYGVEEFRVVLKRRGGYEDRLLTAVEARVRERLGGVAIDLELLPVENAYYRGVQFKLYITVRGIEWEIADGGLVDWTQQLLGNRKERLMISGYGLELLFKMQQGLL